MNGASISVIIASYNGARFITAAIESVLKQSHEADRIIVVDDGSKDDSLDVIEGLRARHTAKLSVYTHRDRENKGIAATYLLGMSKAGGTYVSFLEQDDYWPSNYLESKVRSFEEHPDAGVIYCPYRVVRSGSTGTEMMLRQWLFERRIPKGRTFDNFANLITFNNVATLSCVSVRRSLLSTIPLPHDIPMHLYDWWLICHLSARFLFYYDERTFTYWRIGKETALGSLRFSDLRMKVARFMSALYGSLLDDPSLMAEQRETLLQNAAALPYFLALFETPGVGVFLRFLKVRPRWALECLASMAVNYIKHR